MKQIMATEVCKGIERLPENLLLEVMYYLPIKDLISAARYSMLLYHVQNKLSEASSKKTVPESQTCLD